MKIRIPKEVIKDKKQCFRFILLPEYYQDDILPHELLEKKPLMTFAPFFIFRNHLYSTATAYCCFSFLDKYQLAREVTGKKNLV